MTAQFESTEELKISQENLNSLIDNEVDDFSDELSGYKMNSDMKTAWISEIVPPGVSHPKSTDDMVLIKFYLPSKDVFWERFEVPEMRWPESNEFRQFMESNGVYSPKNLSELVGKEVDVEFEEQTSRWRPSDLLDIRQSPKDSDTNGDMSRYISEAKRVSLLFMLSSLSVLLFSLALVLLFYLKHIGLIFSIVLLAVCYVLVQQVSEMTDD